MRVREKLIFVLVNQVQVRELPLMVVPKDECRAHRALAPFYRTMVLNGNK